ncbi:MAG: hypothetical protein JRI34_12745, partial [Deltaproteobacteria bacterium]|nr:hypothetical protein [Deltaproteobacteria bacterium]
ERPKAKPASIPTKKKKIQRGTIQIVTDRLEADDNNKVVLLKGNVMIRWDEFVLTCDQARALYKAVKVKTKKKSEDLNKEAASSNSNRAFQPVQKQETEVHHEITRVEAEGNVKVTIKNRVALAGKAVYEAKSRLITLTGAPRVLRGKDFLSGDRITMYLDEDRSVIESGLEKKVNATFYQPPKEQDQSIPEKSGSEVKE